MDPESGKTYRVTLASIDEGRKLKVRGYIAMFFRTQYWDRAEAPARPPFPRRRTRPSVRPRSWR